MKKEQLIIVYIVSAILCVWIVVRFVFGPFHEKLSSLSQEARLSEERLKKGLALVAKKEPINKAYEKYASYFSLQSVSDEEATAVFLKEVEKVVKVGDKFKVKLIGIDKQNRVKLSRVAAMEDEEKGK